MEIPASLVLLVKVLTGGRENEPDSCVRVAGCESIIEGDATKEQSNHD